MAEKQAGVTAFAMAYARAYHATHDSPKIFDDFLAARFFTAQELAGTAKMLAGLVGMIDPELAATNPDEATALAAVLQLQAAAPMTLSRSRYTEDTLEERLRDGVTQYVILGAGFDTFAFRRPELAARLRIFEVDHPATQALKRERIAAAGWELPANLHFVPVDFDRESLADALRQSPFDPGQQSLFSWLGVTFYLDCDVNFATLRTIAGLAAPGSTLVFDYIDADAFVPEKAGKGIRMTQMWATQLGEPMKCGFDPPALAGDLRPLGFRLDENLAPEEIDARYFQGRTDRYRAFEHVHLARATATGSPRPGPEN